MRRSIQTGPKNSRDFILWIRENWLYLLMKWIILTVGSGEYIKDTPVNLERVTHMSPTSSANVKSGTWIHFGVKENVYVNETLDEILETMKEFDIKPVRCVDHELKKFVQDNF